MVEVVPGTAGQGVATTTPINVLVVGTVDDPAHIPCFLAPFPDIGAVDHFEGTSGTPSLAQLQGYDAVIVASNSVWADRVAMGDVLADYVDTGGRVLQMSASFDTDDSWGLSGRWVSQGYGAIMSAPGYSFDTWSLGTFDPAHSIMDGVSGVTSSIVFFTDIAPDATLVADWDTEEPLAATRVPPGGTGIETEAGCIVGLNAFPLATFWGGDLPTMVRNSLVWLIDCAGGGASISWLSVEPSESTFGPGGSGDLTVTFDTEDLDPGTYLAQILVVSNDPATPEVPVDVTLTVVGPDIEVAPSSLSEILGQDQTSDQQLVISNTGLGTLVYNISIEPSDGGGSSQISSASSLGINWSDGPVESNIGSVDRRVTASYTLGTLTDGPSILVYTDDYVEGPGTTFVEQALIALGLPATVFYGDYDGFGVALGAGPSALAVWDLVIVSHNNFFEFVNLWSELEAYFNGGGKLLIATFDIDGSHSEATTLWDTLGVQQVLDQGLPEPLYRWDEGHPVFTNPEAVPDMTSPQDDYIDDGDRTEPGAGATAIAGFSPEGTVLVEQVPNMAGIIVRDDGRALVNSFVIPNHRGDLDVDTVTDAVELWINEIQWIWDHGSVRRTCNSGDRD